MNWAGGASVRFGWKADTSLDLANGVGVSETLCKQFRAHEELRDFDILVCVLAKEVGYVRDIR